MNDGYGDYSYSDEPSLEMPDLPAMAPAPMSVVPVGPMYGNPNVRAPLRPPDLPPPMPMYRLPSPSMGAPGPDGIGIVDEALPTGHMLGMSVLLPAAGTITGMRIAGMYGGLGGALGAGSLLNGYRAIKYMLKGDKESDREALVSGTYAVLGLGASVWLFYKGLSGTKTKANKPESDDSLSGVE